MVFGNEYEDEGDERNFGRAEERDDGEQPVSVPAAVERLERVARARVSRDPLSVVEQAPVSDEGAAEPQGVATTGINLESDVWRELFVDEAKETEEEEKGRSATGVTVKTEVREEPEVKREVVVGVLTCSGDPHATDGYDSEYYIAHEAYDSAYEAEHEEDDVVTSERSRSGFISRYTGPEVRRSDRPAFGWSWGAQSEEGAFGAFRSGQGTRTVSKAAMLLNLVSRSRPSSVSFTAVTSAASTAPGRPALKVSSTLATGASAVTQGGSSMSRRATAAPVGSRQSVASPRRVVKTADPFQLSQLVSNAVKLLPMFYSDSATVEKARDFWEMFAAAHTEGLPDQSRLLVFRQKIKGREAERWWGNSSIRAFATLKVRFHNQFLSRTADELWELLETAKRERGESVEAWGDIVSDLCESLDYPNQQMRYQLFRRGLWNKHLLATFNASPASDIPEACEWLMFKDMHHPIEEDDEFSNEEPSKKKKDAPMLASVDALAQQMQAFMKQQQGGSRRWRTTGDKRRSRLGAVFWSWPP
ncbi:hypothetical protein PC118_g6145 [Phytophthora cactorum]|uniref:Retrotransposon gag domain-containing protein n=1 Tax=Phytophthora cactorum TaxID=29920 RepID=A0A8T1GA94_9STRA|nr:hypothetical protein PC112_g3051 [Phytophthora cactorum]KAG2933380.1 hypothetical protein PC115_g5504 [Phytophthora cactorum]KAG2989495.1 hypothetical protein PC118_g6145 [Phytophthora cactorum]KAG3028999.1 hypothetical protein PC119_g6821 [Phytophthora cactorum]